ncbi:hypothetical protein C8J57DRAFT_1728080 [Mycena rebaudengoi]|nr:hypothetical protein C8J57DRAFT_1728080 [Mycena rebaudengoi]
MLHKFVSSALLLLVLSKGAIAIPGPGPVTFPCGSPPNEIHCRAGYLCCGSEGGGGNFCILPTSEIACFPPV